MLLNENSVLSQNNGSGQNSANRSKLSGQAINAQAANTQNENAADAAIDLSALHRESRSRPATEPLPADEERYEQVAIFVDGANLFYAALHLNLEIDYVKLLCKLTRGRRLLRAYFYTGVDRANDKQQGFLLWMRRNGYRVVAKELIQHIDGSKKANLAIEIVVDMMQMSSYCKAMVLLSGDGDLTYAVNAIAYKGVQVEVVSLYSMTSEALISVADRYIDLAAIREDIRR